MKPHSNLGEDFSISDGDTTESVAGPSGSDNQSQPIEVTDEDVSAEQSAAGSWDFSAMFDYEFVELAREENGYLANKQPIHNLRILLSGRPISTSFPPSDKMTVLY